MTRALLLLPLLLCGCGLGNALIGFPAGGGADELCLDDPEDFPSLSAGGFYELSGDLDDGDCLTLLPLSGCGFNESSGESPYVLIRMDVFDEGLLRVDVGFNDGVDGFLGVYRGGFFDPFAPERDCLNANDDADGVSFSAVEVPANFGDSFDIVVTSRFGDSGDFNLFAQLIGVADPT